MKIQITEFKEHEKNTLPGFVDLLLVDVGLEVHGATLHEKNGSKWIGLPARPYEKDGAQSWARIIDFPDREDYRAFQDAALAAIDTFQAKQTGGQTTQAAPQADIPF